MHVYWREDSFPVQNQNHIKIASSVSKTGVVVKLNLELKTGKLKPETHSWRKLIH